LIDEIERLWEDDWPEVSADCAVSFEEGGTAQEVLSHIAESGNEVEHWCAFRRYCRLRRLSIGAPSPGVRKRPLLVQKIEGLCGAIRALKTRKRCKVVTADKIVWILRTVGAPDGGLSPDIVEHLFELKFQDSSFDRFVEAHRKVPRDLLLSLWDAVQETFFDPEQQFEQILDELQALTPPEAMASLFWVCCVNSLADIRHQTKPWMDRLSRKLIEMEEVVCDHSIGMFDRPQIELLRNTADEIATLALEAHALSVLEEQFPDSVPFVLKLYYEGQVADMTFEQKNPIRNRILRDHAMTRTVDIVLTSDIPGAGRCRMFVSQAEDSCLLATSFTEADP
jgi:hypothetical protein